MLRSFAYAASAARDPARRRRAPADFEERAREHVPRAATSPTVDPALLPAGEAAIANLLSIFELEKAIYELRYELDNRPDWVPIPVAGIVRLLEGRMTRRRQPSSTRSSAASTPNPHAVLGAHPPNGGVVVRALRPGGRAVA